MANYATTDEILRAIHAMQDSERKALVNYARRQIQGTQYGEPLDLLHEAMYRALDGRRNWPTHVDFAIFLKMTMDSIVSNDHKMGKKVGFRAQPIEDYLDLGIPGLPSTESTEELLIKKEMERMVQATVAATRADLADDEDALDLLDLYLADEPAREIRRILGMSQQRYNTVYKRVKRSMDRWSGLH